MPIFIDSHPPAELPVDVVRTLIRRAREDSDVVVVTRPLDLYFGASGVVHCLWSAPAMDSVRHAHTFEGVPCGAVRQVQDVAEDEHVSAEERTVARRALRDSLDGPQTHSVGERRAAYSAV